MAPLATNRTTGNTRDEHVSDHNEVHAGHNLTETHRGQTTAAHGGICASTDARLSDARTPTAHTHAIERTTVTTTAYTAVLGDANKVIRMTFAGAATLTIPANATAAFALDTIINPYAAGGALTIAAAAGVTIDNNTSGVAQGVEVSLRKDGTDKWVRAG